MDAINFCAGAKGKAYMIGVATHARRVCTAELFDWAADYKFEVSVISQDGQTVCHSQACQSRDTRNARQHGFQRDNTGLARAAGDHFASSFAAPCAVRRP